MQEKVRRRRNSLPENFFYKKTKDDVSSENIRPCSPVSREDALATMINLNMAKQKSILDKLKLWQDQISSISLQSQTILEMNENEDANTEVNLLKK